MSNKPEPTAGATAEAAPDQNELQKIITERDAAQAAAAELRAENETLRSMLGDLNDLLDSTRKKALDSLDSATRIAFGSTPAPDADGGKENADQ